MGESDIRVAPHARVELAVVGLYLFFVGFQILGPVPIGLGDNGDFPKIFGAIAIGPAPGTEKAVAERYFVTNYAISRARYLWIAHLPSSEYWVAKAAKCLARWFLPQGQFDVRLIGIVHGFLMTLALWLFMRAFRRYRRWQAILAGALLLMIMTDVEYIQFFSTAYADAAAIVFFCCLTAVALNLCLNRESGDWRWVAAFVLFGSLFLSSKLEYQLAVFPLCGLVVFFAFQGKTKLMRALWISAVGIFLATTFGMAITTRRDYRADPIYSVVFMRLAPMSSNPNQVLTDFGLPDQYRRYIGVPPFQDGYRFSPERREDFVSRVTLTKIARYYLAHPGACVRILASDLGHAAPNVNLSDWRRFRMEDYAAHQNDMRFKWWSSLRHEVAKDAWPLGPVFYLLSAILVCACAVRRQLREKFPEWPVIGLLVFVGASTFAVASLGDDSETSRHIIVYQVALDLLLFLFVIKLASLFSSRLEQRSAKLMELATTEAQTAHPATGANRRHL